MKHFLIVIIIVSFSASCSKGVTFTPEHIVKTSGRYLYNQETVIDVYYDQNDLYINWKAGRMKPVVLDANTFFVPDMYQKLRFVEHPTNHKRYLGVVSEDDDSSVTYDYLKVADTFKTARMYLNSKEYNKALTSYLNIQKEDAASTFINEAEFNRLGYDLLRNKEYDNAIAVFKMNVALHPLSENVYDSLADSYARSGDSLQAFNNYKKALELNSGNTRAKEFIDNYQKSHPQN